MIHRYQDIFVFSQNHGIKLKDELRKMRIIKLVGSNDIPIEVGSGEKDELYGNKNFQLYHIKTKEC